MPARHRCLFYHFFMRFQWSVNTVQNAGTQATKHNDYKRPGLRCTVACFQCSCIELQLHSNSMPPSPSLPFEPELHSLWNVTIDLKREKCIEQHNKLRIESSQLWRAGKCFALVVENLRVINDIVKVCEHAVFKVDYFGESNWGTVWLHMTSRHHHILW